LSTHFESRRESDPCNFIEHGFQHLGQLLSASEVAALRGVSDEHVARCSAPGPYGQICHNPWTQLPLLKQTIAGILAPVAAQTLGVRQVTLFQDILINKAPGTATVQWHQDYSYWPLDSPAGVTMWVALEDADRDNGCLRYIPGTHLLGEKHPANFFVDAEQPRRQGLQDLDAESREKEAIDVPARAGEVLAHHPLVWHMSPANHSNRHRHAWSITLLAPGVRWAPEHAPHPFQHQFQPHSGKVLPPGDFPRFRQYRVNRNEVEFI
jgi:hypothetical protein